MLRAFRPARSFCMCAYVHVVVGVRVLEMGCVHSGSCRREFGLPSLLPRALSLGLDRLRRRKLLDYELDYVLLTGRGSLCMMAVAISIFSWSLLPFLGQTLLFL